MEQPRAKVKVKKPRQYSPARKQKAKIPTDHKNRDPRWGPPLKRRRRNPIQPF